jgi:hypothetical protein
VARQGPGRPRRWMAVHDRIRLTGLLRESPAPAGLFYFRVPSRVCVSYPPIRHQLTLDDLLAFASKSTGRGCLVRRVCTALVDLNVTMSRSDVTSRQRNLLDFGV